MTNLQSVSGILFTQHAIDVSLGERLAVRHNDQSRRCRTGHMLKTFVGNVAWTALLAPVLRPQLDGGTGHQDRRSRPSRSWFRPANGSLSSQSLSKALRPWPMPLQKTVELAGQKPMTDYSLISKLPFKFENEVSRRRIPPDFHGPTELPSIAE